MVVLNPGVRAAEVQPDKIVSIGDGVGPLKEIAGSPSPFASPPHVSLKPAESKRRES
jgi:hypothetical protein